MRTTALCHLVIVLAVTVATDARSATDRITSERPRSDGRDDSLAAGPRRVALSTASTPCSPFVVNSFDDVVDANIGDGCCEVRPGQQGCTDTVCTLRAAIQEANSCSGPDTIELLTGKYVLSIPGQLEQKAVTGDLDVSDDLTIEGKGTSPSETVVDGGSIDRVFHISKTVTLSNFTVQHGSVDGAFNVAQGGGIKFEGPGVLTLDRMRITDNVASGRGGGIFNLQGTIEIDHSTIGHNHAAEDGGGIYHNLGTVHIASSTIIDNSTTKDGGGINGDEVLQIDASTVADNQAAGKGGGIFNYSGDLRVVGSTISGNRASQGGGIDNNLGFLDISNTTLTGNTLFDPKQLSPGIANGGGIIVSSTIDNTVSGRCNNGQDPILSRFPDCSSGVDDERELLYVRNSIIDVCKQRIVSEGFNILATTPRELTCTFVAQQGDKVGTVGHPIDVRLGPLQNNGGETPTRELLAGSPAIDAASPALPGSGRSACTTTDQRSRPRDPNCDIGAYEVACDRADRDGKPCEDGDACTKGDLCVSQACQSGTTPCESGAACVVDGCQCDAGPQSLECRIALNPCGNGVVDEGEECDTGAANSDFEFRDSCCSSSCRIQPENWVCHAYPENSCIDNTTCRTRDGICPQPLVKGAGTPCVIDDEPCIFNSSCSDGTCGGGIRLCSVDVQAKQPHKGIVPRIVVRCAKEKSKQRAARCDSKASVLGVEALLSDYGKGLLTLTAAPPDLARSTGMVTTEELSSQSKCTVAAGGVQSACGDEISGEVFICSVQQRLTGGRYRLCKPTRCGTALTRLGSRCPRAVRQGVLDARVVTEITGVKVNGIPQGPRTDTKTCHAGTCS